ncbi:MAG: hypothetical protein ABIR27_00875 [Dokdonella sp.]
MGEAALDLSFITGKTPSSWCLRLAQQAFAALLENSHRLGSFRVAALRTSARTALSAVSVDDRGLLESWLALQVATTRANLASNSLGTLATVELALAASVRLKVPKVMSTLVVRPHGTTIAA